MWAITALVSVVGTIVAEGGSVRPANYLAWVVLAFTAYALAITMPAIAGSRLSVYVDALDARRQVVVDAVVGGIVGLTTGAAIATGAWWLGLPAHQGLTERLIGTTLAVALLAVVVGAVVRANEEYQRQRELQLDALVQAELARVDEVRLADEMRAVIAREVEVALAPAREALAVSAPSPGDDSAALDHDGIARLADVLREVATESVRPLSHRLWQAGEIDVPRSRWWRLPGDVIRRQPFRPGLVVAVFVATAIPTAIQDKGVLGAAVDLGLTSCALAIYLALANVAMRRFPRWHTPIWLLVVGWVQVLNVLSAPSRPSWNGWAQGWPQLAAETVLSVALFVLTSAIGSVRDTRAHLLQVFQEDVDAERVSVIARSRTLARVARSASSHLHGAVQTKLIACAAVIDHAVAAGDIEALTAGLDHARDVLTVPVAAPRQSTNLHAEIAAVTALWAGLVSVTTHCDDRLVLKAPQIEAVGVIVEEAVSNAVRHGGARHVDVIVAGTGRHEIVVEVVDDGAGPDEGEPGLGSRMLSLGSRGRWQLGAGPDGTGARLVAVLPA